MPDDFRCGMVAIVGRPNVGKSTLLNAMVGEKVAIVSTVPQTTRNQIRGMYNDEHCQIVFIDTPGIHMSRDRLDQYMNQSSVMTFDDADCIVYVVDPSRRVGEEELAVVGRLKNVKAPVIVALNKMDLKKVDVGAYIEMLEEAYGRKLQELDNIKLITISAKQEKNLEELVKLIAERLPVCPPLYPQDIVTDLPRRLAISDMIREKLFQTMKDEIPHSIGVMVEDMTPVKGKTLHISAVILVERETQKEIVIGKQGHVLKEVGTAARRDIEAIVDTKVFLELHVKVAKDWRNSPSILQDLGYTGLG